MHKRYVNQCTIELTITPDGPILIKSGKEGADPTKPDMEFVDTYYQGRKTIYLPGSSLKGAIRAHAERIVRTVGKAQNTPPDNPLQLWANDPLNDKYKYLEDKNSKDIYRLSSFTDQMFGNVAIASRLRIEDAYAEPDSLKIEERNGVAIDRVYGSALPGALFNYQVCTAGQFKTKIHLKNFTLAQLGLIALVLRDLNEGWFGIGFAKSRGMGTVEVEYNKVTVQYPGCIIKDDKIALLGSKKTWETNMLLGVGEFIEGEECAAYGFPKDDRQETAIGVQPMDLGFGVQLVGDNDLKVKELFTKAVEGWQKKLMGTPA